MLEKYDIDGNELLTKNGLYSNIPEHCPECHCTQTENYKDFSCKMIQVCEQCKTEMYLTTDMDFLRKGGGD